MRKGWLDLLASLLPQVILKEEKRLLLGSGRQASPVQPRTDDASLLKVL